MSAPRTPAFDVLSVVVPMWNEEASIGACVSAIAGACDELRRSGEIRDFEILVVNDGSSDATAERGAALATGNRRIRLLGHERNRGLGASLRTGFAAATGELVLYTDADLPFDLAEVSKACRLMRIYGADIVAAYRHDRTSEGPVRAVYSFAYNWLIRILFRPFRVRDVNFAFKLIRRRIFEHVRLESEGSFIDAELLISAHRHGYRIIQFGADYFERARGRSTLSSWPVIVRILRELAARRPALRRIRRLPPGARALALDLEAGSRAPGVAVAPPDAAPPDAAPPVTPPVTPSEEVRREP